MIEQYLGQPELSSQDVLVTGYDFFTDTATLIAEELDVIHGNASDRLITDTWTATDLRESWTDNLSGKAPDLSSINAHFEHWRIQPADPNSTFYNTYILNA